MTQERLMQMQTPEAIEHLMHIITGIIGGCASALPLAVRKREFMYYILAAYGLIGGLVAMLSGVAMYAFFADLPMIGFRAMVFAGFMGLFVPVLLLLLRTIINVHVKTPIGELDVKLHDEHERGDQ